MRWIQKAWEKLPEKVIINPWKQIKMVGETLDSSIEREIKAEEAALDDDISHVVTV